MNKIMIIGAVSVLAVAIGLVAFAYHPAQAVQAHTASGGAAAAAQQGGSGATGGSNATVLFSSTPYYSYSYLVSTSNPSKSAQAALSGFNVSRKPGQNGSTVYSISLVGSGSSQNITLSNGENLYIIETTFGDDGFGREYSLGDDGFVVVNQQGYIVG